MSLSEISIRRPVFAWILMFGLIFFGYLSYKKMGVNENPDVDFPSLSIRYTYIGATPEVIEKDVIEPVESVLISMQGIRYMNSVSERGGARITLEFELDKDIDFSLQEVQTLLGRAQRILPESIEPPVVTKSNADDDPIMYLSLIAPNLTMRELMILFRDQIRDRFATVDGVAEVRAFGYHEPQLRIDLNIEKMKLYQVTSTDVIDSIRREHIELPAGKLEFKNDENLIRVLGENSKVDEFKNLIISRRGGSPNYRALYLKDIANIYLGIENIKRISRVNGQSAMGMAIQKQRGVNAVQTADRVMERIKQINKELPQGTELIVNFDRTLYIRDSVDELVFTILLSALFTSLVCWLFLGSLSATVNILLAIPTAVVGTFIIIHQLGFTLNTFSLLGLALAIGIVVDDAIIVLENIVRYMQKGLSRIDASFKGSEEIGFAVLATTLALVAIFIPIGFMDGIEGKFFFEFGVTISIAIALSSLEALTLAPMRCSQFLEIGERKSKFGRSFENLIALLTKKYDLFLRKCLQHPKTIIFSSSVIVLMSFVLPKFLEFEFVPPQDRGVLMAMFTAPEGRSMEYTDQKVKQFEEIVLANSNVKRVFVAIGGFGQGGQGNRGNGIIILKPQNERTESQEQIVSSLRNELQKIEGIRFFLRDRFGSALGGRRGSPVEFTISGPDPKEQIRLFELMKTEMENTGLFQGVRSDDASDLPEITVIPNREKSIKYGVEISEIANIMNVSFGGTVANYYTDGARRFQIFVQLKEEDRRVIEQIANLQVRNNRGELVQLSHVVDIKNASSPQYVYRENRMRGVRVDSNLSDGVKDGTAITAIEDLAKKILPDDYIARFVETPKDKLWGILYVMFLGLLVAYMVLAIQFNSFIDPIIVFLAIPFGLIGSLLILLISGQTLNVYSVIGILLTMGIVKKNSILLVEFTNQLRDRGNSIYDSLIEACPVRLRPILMTTLSTLAAAIPPALALGPGAETRIPMALTVIGGTLVSVVFTLFVVPCVYLVIAPKRIKIVKPD